MKFPFCILLIYWVGGLAAQQAPLLYTADIDHFWAAYDALPACKTRADSIRAFQERYIDRGTQGLKEFIEKREFTAEEYYQIVRAAPKFWASIRPNTLRVKEITGEIKSIYRDYAAVFPDHDPPAICFAIGTLRTGGTTSKSWILIGAEILCADHTTHKSELNPWLQSVMTDSFEVTHLIAHEYAHTLQPNSLGKTWGYLTHRLLMQSLTEGAADFLAEKITGVTSNEQLHAYGEAHQAEIWAAFQKEILKNDYNLSPSRYVSQSTGEDVLPLEDAVVLLKEAEEERAKADKELKKVLKELGF